MTLRTLLVRGMVAALGSLVLPTLATAAPAGLIHYWNANGTTTDSVGGAMTTLVNGAGFGAGRQGQAFSFDGIDDRVHAAVNISPSALPAMTIGGWFNVTGASGRDWGVAHDNGGFDRALILSDTRYGAGVAAGVGRTYTSTLPAMRLNTWNFMAVSYQGNGQSATVFLNGLTQTVANVINTDGNAFFTIGGLSNFGNHEFRGFADDIFVYNRALSLGELSSIQRNGVVPEPGSLALIGLGLAGLALRRRRKAA